MNQIKLLDFFAQSVLRVLQESKNFVSMGLAHKKGDLQNFLMSLLQFAWVLRMTSARGRNPCAILINMWFYFLNSYLVHVFYDLSIHLYRQSEINSEDKHEQNQIDRLCHIEEGKLMKTNECQDNRIQSSKSSCKFALERPVVLFNLKVYCWSENQQEEKYWDIKF